jgi:hypothetical protein
MYVSIEPKGTETHPLFNPFQSGTQEYITLAPFVTDAAIEPGMFNFPKSGKADPTFILASSVMDISTSSNDAISNASQDFGSLLQVSSVV